MDDSPRQFFQVVNVAKGNVVIAQKVAWAGSSADRRQGLLGRSGLSADEGIYLVRCEWLHTFGMGFPIDVAFISSSGQILAIYHGLKPNRLSKIVFRAEGALELSAGTLRVTNTAIGDAVQFLNSSMSEPITF